MSIFFPNISHENNAALGIFLHVSLGIYVVLLEFILEIWFVCSSRYLQL